MAVGGEPLSDVVVIDPVDWNTILIARPNVLACGDPSFIDAFLSVIRPHCSEPIHAFPTRHLPSPVQSSPVQSLSLVSSGTVILNRVADYDPAHQRVVLQWLEERGWVLQVIATTDRPLLDQVQRGAFSASLYYRLNTVYLDLGCPISSKAGFEDVA